MTRGQQRPRGAAAIIIVLAAALTFGGAPRPARAEVPDVARTWAMLMYRSLTVKVTLAQLNTALATRQAAVTGRAADVTVARTANDAAQARLTAATAAETGARTRYATAVKVLADARKTLSRLSKQRPRNRAATARAQKAVTAATAAAGTRRDRAGAASAVRAGARTDARTATTALTAATAAWNAAATAVRRTRQRIAGVGTAAGLARQAAAIGKDVVGQTRPGFTVADTATVYGITVHRSVAYAFQRMIDDAKAAGINLSGGGFRTRERQIELRKINGCPDIWTAPSSSCRVPTAIPGHSLHEIGLAVDITSGGRTIGAKTPAFRWLAAHAAAYGFVNLPSEPWHWSITGS